MTPDRPGPSHSAPLPPPVERLARIHAVPALALGQLYLRGGETPSGRYSIRVPAREVDRSMGRRIVIDLPQEARLHEVALGVFEVRVACRKARLEAGQATLEAVLEGLRELGFQTLDGAPLDYVLELGAGAAALDEPREAQGTPAPAASSAA